MKNAFWLWGLWAALWASEAGLMDYRLGPGDVLDISVFEAEELSGPALVASDGTVSLPLVGAVSVAGMTARQAAERLQAAYGQNLLRNPQISVAVREHHSQPVSVLGAVRRPGVYQLRGRRRLSEVLALAEGLAPDAGSEIAVVRPLAEGGERTIRVATRELLRLGRDDEHNPWIEARDSIRVARAGVVYVVGDVGRPGGFPLKEQECIGVLQALSLAEGLRRTAAPEAVIIRSGPEGRRELPVRVRDILKGRTEDVPLQANDVLFVPHSPARGAMGRVAEAAIQAATGIAIWRR